MKRTLLLVDDSRNLVSLLANRLEDKYDIVSCYTPEHAIRRIDDTNQTVDLVILDIMMPHGETLSSVETDRGLRTGLVIFQRLREVRKKVPVLVLTNVHTAEILNLFTNDDLLRVVRKPMTPPALIEQEIADLIRRSS